MNIPRNGVKGLVRYWPLSSTRLQLTTQFVDTVEAETRTMPHHHFKVQIPSLRPGRCQEGFHSDTVFTDIRLTRGFECGKIFIMVLTAPTHMLTWWKERDIHHLHWETSSKLLELQPICIMTMHMRKCWGSRRKCARCIVPLKLPKNKAELWIQDIKWRARLLMQLNDAQEKS